MLSSRYYSIYYKNMMWESSALCYKAIQLFLIQSGVPSIAAEILKAQLSNYRIEITLQCLATSYHIVYQKDVEWFCLYS